MEKWCDVINKDVGLLLTSYLYSWSTTSLRATGKAVEKVFLRHAPIADGRYMYIEATDEVTRCDEAGFDVYSLEPVDGKNKFSNLGVYKAMLCEIPYLHGYDDLKRRLKRDQSFRAGLKAIIGSSGWPTTPIY